MPNAKNQQQFAMLTEKAAKAKSVFVTNYMGLSVKQQTNLRKALKKAGGEFIVAKNTLIARVLGKEELKQSLQGQTGVLFSYDDEVAALKELVAFAKDTNLPEVKQGLMDGVVLSTKDVMKLSSLPGKQELLSKVLRTLQTPGNNLVGVLNGSARNLVQVMAAYQKKLSENA